MSYFSYVGKLFSNVKGFYNEINAATLTGAIDTVIIQQGDGTFKSSPFHVRFGKLGVLRSREKVVDIEINGEPVDIQMKLGETGEAFFVEEFEDEEEELPSYLATSPLHHDINLMEKGLQRLKRESQELARITEGQVTEVTGEGQSDVKGRDEVKVDLEGVKVIQEEEDKTNKREHLDSVRSESTVKSDHSRDADIEIKIDAPETVNKNRKKRRRKRKNNNGQNSQIVTKIETYTTNDPQEHPESGGGNNAESAGNVITEEMFEMEDLSTDDELSRLTSTMTNGCMSKSISLPVVEENRLARTNEWASAHEGFSYLNSHPFSDTDLSPLASPQGSRPHTPKSDTEVDRQKSLEQDCLITVEDNESVTWEWGNLPKTNKDYAPSTPKLDDKGKSGGLFHFMRKTKNVRHKPEAEGIYLDDLNLKDMDEETAKLYFPKRFSISSFQCIQEKDEDVESGRGASLPVSPHSVEGAIGGPTNTTGIILESEIRHLGAVSLSLCGGLGDPEPMTLTKFMSKVLTFDDLCESPGLMSNPDLVVRMDDKYYNWATAAPLVLARMAFDKPLPAETVENIASHNMPKKKEKKGGYSWFSSWRRQDTTQVPTTSTTSTNVSMANTADPTVSKSEAESVSPVKSTESLQSGQSSELDKSPKKISDRLRTASDHSSSEGDTEGSEKTGDVNIKGVKRTKRVCKRSLRLTSDRIKQLNLQLGQNEVVFSVTTQYQGTKRCHSHIYLWKHSDKIIVSDIDGTITKSDVLGQILPVMGRDWSQSGVAQLYSRISGNGYKFLYLSARAIGQSKLTKDLLNNIRQGEMTLPEGPLLLSPTSLISAFHKEVIERKPEEFKISCLTDIGSLFPEKMCPFYAGFGNKVNDVYAYKAISIPTFRIFTINPYGELKHELSYTFQSSYTKLTDVVDHFFPPVHKLPHTLGANEYNQVQYWREPLPEISHVEIDGVRSGKSSSSSSHSTALSETAPATTAS